MGAAIWKVFIEYKDGSTAAFSTQHPKDTLASIKFKEVAEVSVKHVGSD